MFILDALLPVDPPKPRDALGLGVAGAPSEDFLLPIPSLLRKPLLFSLPSRGVGVGDRLRLSLFSLSATLPLTVRKLFSFLCGGPFFCVGFRGGVTGGGPLGPGELLVDEGGAGEGPLEYPLWVELFPSMRDEADL